jgi:O-succinylbenzoic acid--CoA ligase
VTSRPLHAVLLPPGPGGGRLPGLLAAALDGTGPAILPLDPALPAARLAELLAAFWPDAVITPQGTERGCAPGQGGRAGPGTAPDTAVVIATSGSTGAPKGVELTAAALRASAAASLARVGAGPGERWLCCLPGFHVAGLQVLVRCLLAGAEPLVTQRAGPAEIAAAARSGGRVHVSLVPTQLRRLLDDAAPLERLGTILLGGAAPAAGLLEDAAAAGARVVTTYGMSETCGGCVYDGIPLDGVRARLTGAGLIQLAGPVLFSRYRPDGGGPGEDGWFTTSDLGALDGRGRLRVRGRADEVINTGGEKVVPGEVEAVLGALAGVAEVVVIGMADREWGEVVTAVIVPADPGAPPDLADLRERVRAELGGAAAPRRMRLLDALPMLASGKPDRRRLRMSVEE